MGYGLISQSIGQWTAWTTVFTGFSSDPATPICRYTLNGKMCTVKVTTGNGTSNATTFTMTLPFTAATTGLARTTAIGTDNGTGQDSWVSTASGSNILNCFRTTATNTWTASGSKAINFILTYEIA